MKVKKVFVVLFILILIIVGFNIKKIMILNDIYEHNKNIPLYNFYYREKEKNENFENESIIYCKDNVYILNYNSKYIKDNNFYNEVIWVNENTNEFVAYQKSNETNLEWQLKSEYTEYSVDNPKTIVNISHMSYHNSLMDLIIFNIFNDIENNKDMYYIKSKDYEYYIDKNTYECKEIISKKKNIYIEIIEFSKDFISDDISKITIDELDNNN